MASAALIVAGGAGAYAMTSDSGGARPTPVAARSTATAAATTSTAPTVPAATTTAPKPRAPRPAPSSAPRPSPAPVTTVPYTASEWSPRTGPPALAGCPPPPHPPIPYSPPWHPAVLVPDSALPPVSAPAPWHSNLAAIDGTGMWIWQWNATNGGNAAAVVARARAAHLHQVWVRVGDSLDGFYGAGELAALVPAAHAAGLSVIGWGFPYLYNPVGDAKWSAQALAWRSPAGQQIDGWSADIERSSEGVDITAQRAAVYLQAVRRAAGSRLLVATVYPPTDAYWGSGGYPFKAMAPYVDAFAPMVYWECTDPGSDAQLAVSRLATLRPVHVIGQAFNLADVGGRVVSPSPAEITEFLQASQRSGAVGASLWVWQDATAPEWLALASYRW